MSFRLTDKEIAVLKGRIASARIVPAPENSLGQWIGYIVDDGTSAVLDEIVPELVKETGRKFTVSPQKGEKTIRLKNSLGQDKQIDHAIKEDGVYKLIVESKWLKDQRHLNDKGSWILMMGDILFENKNLNGIVVVLAGPWESMRSVIEKRAETVIVPTQEVYDCLSGYGIDIPLDLVRNAYKDPGGSLANFLSKAEQAVDDGTDFTRDVGYNLLKGYMPELKQKIEKLLPQNS
jgi:hypothetical protein